MSFKSIEMTGKTEDEAIEKALTEVGKSRDEVSVEIIERAKSGFLGLGATPATIRISYEEQDSRAKVAEDYLSGLFAHMETSATAAITETDDGLSIELKGDKLGSLIGRRGETLDAIQHLTNYTVNRGFDTRVRISIDAENYRKKREESLIALAERIAVKAVRYKRNFTLEPMNSYERHVIHTALQDNDLITTYSTGTEPNRRIVVAYSKEHSPSDSSETPVQEWS